MRVGERKVEEDALHDDVGSDHVQENADYTNDPVYGGASRPCLNFAALIEILLKIRGGVD